ncbi:Rieske [Sesbania bispinosa]|nr:Rieske [Sesbania bispinosa]
MAIRRRGKMCQDTQLPADAKIPRSACVKTYEVRDSQGVIWVWMSTKTPPDVSKIPWFENFARPGFQDISTTHELPYDHSILLENLMDPAHIPISHDRTDWTAKREDAQPLCFEVTERTDRGFAGWWGREKDGSMPNFLRFEAPCVLQNTGNLLIKMVKKTTSLDYQLPHPAKGGVGTMHAPNLANRYFRHVIHCKGCRTAVKAFQAWKNALSAVAVALAALAILVSGRQWKALLLVSASLCSVGVYACSNRHCNEHNKLY